MANLQFYPDVRGIADGITDGARLRLVAHGTVLIATLILHHTGMEHILPAVIDRIPPPPVEADTPSGVDGADGALVATDSRWAKAEDAEGNEMLKALLFDSWYE